MVARKWRQMGPVSMATGDRSLHGIEDSGSGVLG